MVFQEQRQLVLWRMLDGKSGHEAQTLGLVQALQRRCVIKVYNFSRMSRCKALSSWITGSFPDSAECEESPDLIIGAGHGTHLTMLAAKRATSGKTVVLMKPSMPSSWFDFCFIPEHDQPALATHSYVTKGVLNTVVRSDNQAPDRGLILIGGPSTHYKWDTCDILQKIKEIVEADRSMVWTLTTSRRTPSDCLSAVVGLKESNLEVVPFAQTKSGWVNDRLNECGTAWVTEDSVSMVYESLTSGAGVGLLPVPLAAKGNRVTAGVLALQSAKMVEIFTANRQNYRIKACESHFAEADRCATILLKELT